MGVSVAIERRGSLATYWVAHTEGTDLWYVFTRVEGGTAYTVALCHTAVDAQLVYDGLVCLHDKLNPGVPGLPL